MHVHVRVNSRLSYWEHLAITLKMRVIPGVLALGELSESNELTGTFSRLQNFLSHMRVKFWEQEYGYDRISWLWTGKSQIRKLSTVQSLTRRGSPSRMPYIYRQMIKELLLESAQLSRKFARKSAVEVERIVKILARQAKYTYLLTYSMEHSPSWEANWFCS